MGNYFIIGDDAKEYGPVSIDELRQWIAENRVGAQTKVRSENSTELRPLSQTPELAALLKKPAPPPPPISAPVTAGRTSALAVGALVLGILGVFTCGATALFGLVLGIIAIVRINASRGALRGHGMALGGTIISGIVLLLVPILVAMLLPALASAKQKAMGIACMNNEKQLALAVLIYSGDHTNHYPSAATWCDDIKPSVGSENVFKCPGSNRGSSRCDYAFNARLEGLDASKVNPQTVVIFESDSGWNAHGGPELLCAPRHNRTKGLNVGFADGHIEMVAQARLRALRWDP
jgi:prepilin-type processing-associated H-X9-DG protein